LRYAFLFLTRSRFPPWLCVEVAYKGETEMLTPWLNLVGAIIV
jgi:hypothetical protein